VPCLGRRVDHLADVAQHELLLDGPAVHHVNKGSHDDFVAQVSGTYGVAGSVDTILNVDRKRTEAFGTIAVTGRDIADGLLSVRFTDMTWIAAPEALAEASFQRTEIYRAIEAIGPLGPRPSPTGSDWSGRTSSIASSGWSRTAPWSARYRAVRSRTLFLSPITLVTHRVIRGTG
jgi:hypothetical protein